MWRIICNTQGRNLSKLDFDRKKPEIELLNREKTFLMKDFIFIKYELKERSNYKKEKVK